MGYLDKQGLQRVWDKIKSLFASSLSFSNRTLTLKNKNGDTLSSVELPYRGIYFVKGTQTAATGTWKGALPEVESLYDGLTIAYFLPYAGSGDATLTLTLKNSTTQAEPVYYNNSNRATTHYGAGATVVLTWVSNATTGYAAVGSALGRWTRADYNSNTVPTAYCTTAAGTAAKTASCTNYNLLSNSFVPVLIQNSNTSASALTMNINSKGNKPIYINGTASSANNYTLPAGTYLAFYDGTNYYFNTDGTIHGHLPLSGGQMTGPLSWKNGTALSAKTSDINYLLTIDSFADGGVTKYATMANVANAITPTVETAVENDYIMLTKKSDMVIPANSDLNDYTQPGFYICPQSEYAKTVSNVPQAAASTTQPFPWAFSLEIQPTVMTASYTISGVRQILRRYGDPTKTNELNNHPATWERDYYNSWGVWRRTSSIIYNAYTNNRQTNLDFPNAENGMGAMFHTVASGTETIGKPFSDANLLQMNWDTANGYDSQLAIGTHGKWLGFRGQSVGTWRNWNYAQSINFGICETASATAAKVVTMNNPCSGIDGMEMDILFVNGDTSGAPTITVNIPGGTMGTNIALLYKGKPVEPAYIKAGDVIKVVYHNAKWNVVGCINSVTSYGNHILYHIKCTDGNDNNDGLTENTAFKTLDKFFEVTANSGYTDCRCRLDQAGDYYLNKQAANNITWHCRIGPSVTSGDVRIVGNYGVEESWIMYNSHVKLSGRYPEDYKSTDTARIPLQYIGYNPGTLQGIYFENCAVTLENVIFNCTVRTFGCYVNATKGLTANRLYLYGSDGIVEDLKIEATSNGTNPAIQVWRGSSIRFSSPNSNNTLDNSNKEFGVKSLSAAATNPKNIFLDIRDSSVVLASKMPQNLANPYYFGIKCVNAELTGKRAVLGTFQTRCVSGKIAADEETELNVSWGEPAFNSLYGVESVQITTPQNDQAIPANAIKTWTISKATIQAAIAVDHPYSTFPYKILAVVPCFTSDNRVIIKDAFEDTSTENVTVIGRNVASSQVSVGATATVNILYTLKSLNIVKES